MISTRKEVRFIIDKNFHTGFDTVGPLPTAKTQVIPQLENLFKALLFPSLIVALLFFANHIALQFDTLDVFYWQIVKWLIIILCVVSCTLLMNGMGVLAHDGVHRVLFKNNLLNDTVSSLLSAFTLIPFFANREFHLQHHRFAHQPGKDPENVIHNRPFLVAFFIGPFFALFAQYKLVFRHIMGWRSAKYRSRALGDIFTLGLAYSCYYFFLPLLGLSYVYTIIPLLILLPLSYNFRAISDHYGLPAVKEHPQASEQIQNETSGWLVFTHPVLEWLWSHVNYHEVHHKFPYLSHTYLPQMYQATKDTHRYQTVHGYTRSLLNLRKLKYYEES